jgi:hypothetical protein
MTIAIMQPYFLPYIGYFQLINAVDKFIIYDNLQYVSNGWIQRNRILVNGKDDFISLAIKKDIHTLQIKERFLSDNFQNNNVKIIRRIEGSYKKAPYFKDIFPYIEQILLFEDNNLFNFVFNSINIINKLLNIQTSIIISSSIPIDNALKSEEKVIAINRHLKSDIYINPIGGVSLYSKDEFRKNGLTLNFLKTRYFEYTQFNNQYIPYLSIIDVLMFNPINIIIQQLKEFDLL